MYDVLDVSRYIITYCNEKGYPISNLKLQKLLYFVQAYFLVTKNEPCFPDEIEAWPWGPVVRKAYFEFNSYGANNIFLFFNDSQMNIMPDDHIRINDVLLKLANLPAYTLVEITHSQEPWKKVYNQYCNNIIEKESIKQYFSSINNHDKF